MPRCMAADRNSDSCGRPVIRSSANFMRRFLREADHAPDLILVAMAAATDPVSRPARAAYHSVDLCSQSIMVYFTARAPRPPAWPAQEFRRATADRAR